MNKTLLFLGAGTAKPLGGKLTEELTSLIINKSRLKDKNGANFISHLAKIIDSNNFEKILGALDYVYYLLMVKENNLPKRFYKNWIDLISLNEIADNIPNLSSMQINNMSYFENNKYEDFLINSSFEKKFGLYNLKHRYIEFVIMEIYSIIQNHVYEYSQTEKRNTFNKYLNRINENTDFLRIYSLNYDCLPQLYFESSGIKYSNGFSIDDNKLDIKSILTNETINCFYSLHGNIYLKTDGINKTGGNDSQRPFANSQFDFSNFISNNKPDSLFLNDRYFHTYNDSKYTFDTGIISGFSKTELILEQPYQAYFHAFEKDILNVSKIIIIGYSFSDAHINRVIKNAVEARINDSDFTIEIVNKIEYQRSSHFPELLDNCFDGKRINYHLFNKLRVEPTNVRGLYTNLNCTNTLKVKINYEGFSL